MMSLLFYYLFTFTCTFYVGFLLFGECNYSVPGLFQWTDTPTKYMLRFGYDILVSIVVENAHTPCIDWIQVTPIPSCRCAMPEFDFQ
jgi:hypothetical protein